MTLGTPEANLNTLQILNDLIHQRTGHFFENGSLDRLQAKIEPLVLARGLDSFLDYYYLLKYGEDTAEEWQRIASALAVNETYFWREWDQIRVAAEVLAPRLRAAHPLRPIRIWHAACASGEEPYSMAIALQEAGAFLQGPIEIVATDFNPVALQIAQNAVFRPRSFRSLPYNIHQTYFTPAGKDQLRLVDSIRSRVQFFPLNLMDAEQMARMCDFDMIFCRNVFIYFSTSAIRQTAERLHAALRSPGYLFIAAAESLLRLTTLFDLDEIDNAYVYLKS